MDNQRNQMLLEAIADIAYIAGEKQYYGGDSRRDVSDFIQWAKEFEELHKETDWSQLDYIETITAYTYEKLNK